MIRRFLVSFLVALTFSGCAVTTATHKPAVLVGQSGLAITQSIGAIQTSVKQLTDANVIPPNVALGIQTQLLAINTKLAPLPDLLRAIDALEAAGNSEGTSVEQALAILKVVGQDLSIVVSGVPAAAAASSMIDLVRAAQATIQTTMIEVAKLKGA